MQCTGPELFPGASDAAGDATSLACGRRSPLYTEIITGIWKWPCGAGLSGKGEFLPMHFLIFRSFLRKCIKCVVYLPCKLISECNSQKGHMEQKERMVTLSTQLEFKETLRVSFAYLLIMSWVAWDSTLFLFICFRQSALEIESLLRRETLDCSKPRS